MPEHLKILTLSNVPLDPMGGSGKKRLAWKQGWEKLGCQMDVIEPQHFEWAYGKIRLAKKFRQSYGAWQYFNKHEQWKDYDILEFYGDEFWLVMSQLYPLKKRPLMIACTDGLELLAYDSERRLSRSSFCAQAIRRAWNELTHYRLSPLAFRHADAFTALCERDRQEILRRKYFDQSNTLVTGIALDSEYHLPFRGEKEFRVAFTGTWIDRKGVGVLVQVMSDLLHRYPQLCLDIFGTGGEHAKVVNSFASTLHSRIHVYDKMPTSALADRLSRARVFFFPTQYEGYGIATAEAMACSCAVVTTPTGLGWELESGKEAMICDFDDIAKMTQAVEALLTDDAVFQKIAHAGWEKTQALRLERCMDTLQHTYSQWLKHHKALP